MTVEELITELQQLPGHLPVVIHVELESDGDQVAEVDEFADAHSVCIGNPGGYTAALIRM